MGREIAVDGRPHGGEEGLLAKLRKQPESLQLVLDRVLHLGEAQLDARCVQGMVQFGQHVGGGDVHAGDRFGRHDQPAHRRRRSGHRIERALVEQFGVGEEQRRIPAEQDQAGDQARAGIALDVVVALDALRTSEDGRVRAPAVPQEFDHGDHDRQADAGNRAEHRHADGADDGQPELPALDAQDPAQVGDLDQADGGSDHDGGQRAGGQVLQQVGRHHQQQGHAQRADDAGQLAAGARCFCDGGARRAAADRKALEEPGGEVGGAEPDHLLVGVDVAAGLRRVDAREHAGVGEGNEGDGKTAGEDGTDVGWGDPRNGKGGQALRQGAEHLHAGARVEAQRADDERRADHGDQDAGQALAALERQDRHEGGCADCERGRVGAAFEHRRGNRPQVPQRAAALDREAEQLGQLADQHRQRDAVHVAVADRLGQEFGDEAQARHAGQDARHPGDDGHHAGQRDGARRVAVGQRQDDGEDDRGERRVGAQHQDAAGAEQRIREQRDDRRVEAVDARHPGRHGIGDADRHQHRRQHQSRDEVVAQPGRLVAAQRHEARQPARPPGPVGTALRARDAAGFEAGWRRGGVTHVLGRTVWRNGLLTPSIELEAGRCATGIAISSYTLALHLPGAGTKVSLPPGGLGVRWDDVRNEGGAVHAFDGHRSLEGARSMDEGIRQPGGRRRTLAADLIPGLTTSAVVVPKALAYATIAQLPVQAGLFAALVPMAVYAVLGTSRLLSVSTTTPIAILCATAIGEALRNDPGLDPLTSAATLSVLVGVMLIAARALRLGFLANFISEPVLTGFKAGVGFVIVVDQLPKLLGIHITKEGFFRDVVSIFAHAPELSWPTLAVAVGTLAVIFLAKRFLPKSPAPLLAVAVGIAASAIVGLEAAGVSVVGSIQGGLPMPQLPRPSLFQAMWPAAAGIALISFTESIAAARAFVRPADPPLEANRELFALGAANAAGAFIGSMPAGGGTSQTAVNRNAGAQTQAASLVVAAVAFATLLFLAPVLALMPHATLAAVVIAYSIGLVNPAEIAAIRRVRTMEFRWAVVACLGVMVLGTLKGIVVAIVLSLLGLMYLAYDPRVDELRRKPGTNVFRPHSPEQPADEAIPGLLIVRPEDRLFFVNAANVSGKLQALTQAADPKVVLLDCSAIPGFEYTALKMLVEGEERQREQGRELWLAALSPEALEMVQRTPLAARLGRERMFFTVEQAVDAFKARGLASSQD